MVYLFLSTFISLITNTKQLIRLWLNGLCGQRNWKVEAVRNDLQGRSYWSSQNVSYLHFLLFLLLCTYLESAAFINGSLKLSISFSVSYFAFKIIAYIILLNVNNALFVLAISENLDNILNIFPLILFNYFVKCLV